MQSGFMRRVLLASAATVALLTAPAMAVSSFERTTPGFFDFTIDEAGTYQLTIGGATGGSNGGAGAFFSGSVYMGNGNVFSGLVGGDGVSGGGNPSGGGGGGGLSYFLSGATSAYVGGGGGGFKSGAGYDSNGRGGTGAGGSVVVLVGGGGGAGVSGNGGSSGSVTGGSSGPTWSGGTYYGSASGGFGGGGAGDFNSGGGGGGGFTGGNGGNFTGGQGGTSNYAGFISSILQGGTDRRSNPYAGDLSGGFFSFTLTSPAVSAVPVPASLGLLGLAIAGLIAQSRRRKA